MFPLNDTEPNRYGGFPKMTLTIIFVNVLVLLWEYHILNTQGILGFMAMVYLFGTSPQLVISRVGLGAVTAITSMFMHGGWFHLISNMWALWVFGRRVEDACGAWRFLAYYLLCGVFADIISILVHYRSLIPGIGASGAIFGVMGAYLLLFPGGRIRTLITALYVPLFPRLRAYWVILYFLIIQIPPALNILVFQADYNVGYWAHLGGFFAAVFIPFFLRPEAMLRYMNEVPV